MSLLNCPHKVLIPKCRTDLQDITQHETHALKVENVTHMVKLSSLELYIGAHT